MTIGVLVDLLKYIYIYIILKHRILVIIQNLLILSNCKISTAVRKTCV